MFDRISLATVSLIIGLLPALAQEPVAQEVSNEDALTALKPTKLMEGEAKWLGQVLQRAHYSKVSLNNLDRIDFLETYMSRWDRQRMFFLEGDRKKFLDKFVPTIATYVKQGNLHPAFEIYSVYKRKALARMDWALKRLKSDFDFKVKESYAPNRDESDWPKTKTESDSLWELRLKYEVLGEILSLISDDDGENPVTHKEVLNNQAEARTKLHRRYERWQKTIQEYDATGVQVTYLTTLTQMFDPHSTFLSIDAVDEFNVSMKNSFVGIGAVLKDEDGYCTIKELLPGGPAEESRQLEPEDIIMKVAQDEGDFEDVVDAKLKDIVKKIKGKKGTVVRLMIKPVKNPSVSKIVELVRAEIKLTRNLAEATVHEVPNGEETCSIGVIELPSFYGDTRRDKPARASDDVAELIEKLEKIGIDGLVLDLRRNGGGFLSEAINLTGLFISRGPVVQVKGTDGKTSKRFDFNPKVAWDGPLILLVSRYSASASEIVAGALQHHERAIIVGDPATHGKGTVQSMIEMNSSYLYGSKSGKRSAAKITIQKYYLPSGNSTQNIGVTSDIKMNTINEFLPIGESDLPHALEPDKIDPVISRRGPNDFVIEEKSIPYLEKLSRKRQDTLAEFDHLQTNIDWYKVKQEQKEYSLNLENRLAQKKEDDAFSERMKASMDKLASTAFPSKPVKLDIVLELERKSKAARSEEDEDEKSDEPPASIDIRLREGLRIMSDWIRRRAEVAEKVAETPIPGKES
ncbi:MAG: tail-specific protease [Opitutaceae bacterium]|nr:tail-specific protease [Opitutaceae bacterium]